jgi:hypothetical protein
LTGTLDEDVVLSWYRVILESEAAVPNPFEQDPYLRAAADLARAEAHLQRVRSAEEHWLQVATPPPSENERLLEEERDRLLDALLEDVWFSKDLEVASKGRSLQELFRRLDDDEVIYRLLEEHARDLSVQVGWDRKGRSLLWQFERMMDRERMKQQGAHEKTGRTLARYRTSAEARRRAALRRLIAETAKRTQSGGRNGTRPTRHL